MKVRQLFVIVFGLMIAVVAVSILTSFALMREMTNLENITETRYLSYQSADELRQSSDDLTRLGRTYVLTGDVRYKKMYEDVLAIRNGKMPRPKNYHRIYWDLVIDHGQKPVEDGQTISLEDSMRQLGFLETEFSLLKEAQGNSDKLVGTEVEAFNAIERGDQGHAISIMHDLTYHQEKAKIMEPINRFFSELESRTHRQVNDSEASVTRLAYTLTGLLCSVGLLAIVGYVLIVRKVAAPIKVLSDTINEVEKSADLTQGISLQGKDEVSILGMSLGNLLEKIRNLLVGVGEIAQDVDTSAKRTNDFAVDTSDRMSRQAQEVEVVATAIHQMSVALADVAKNTNEAASVANDAYSYVESGKEVATGSQQTMNNLLQQMTETSNSVDDLATNFKQIESVLDVIKNIAEQTNLLALNAAIEAARAGESGRGFAVVADEVRTLAQRTQKSTGEIEAMISTVSHGMDQTINAISEGMSRVNVSNETVIETRSILDKINHSVNLIRDMNSQIATATEEQSATVESVNRSVLEVKNLADDTSGSTQDLKQTFSHLSISSKDLVERMSIFKV